MTKTTHSGLAVLDEFPIPVLASFGHEHRARHIAQRTCRALDWLAEVTGKAQCPTLVVAGPEDWHRVCEVPIYGMPFSIPDKIGTSPTPAEWWDDYVDVLRPRLSSEQAATLDRTYGDPADYTALADLIVTHEATHLFHEIDPVTWASEFPDDWVMELFANIGMHGYLATHEPDRLPLLSVMADATVAAGPEPWALRDLSHMGQAMQASTTNYVWYEFLLIRLAAEIWDAGGADAMRDYHRQLGHRNLTADQITARVAAIAPAVADALRNWPHI
jgi:hypothetical protein